jgi:NAD-dependent dihydropyrimidine dehydrogenase PreA subunit
VKVCPVDCIHGPIYTTNSGKEILGMSSEDKKGKQLYINPDECVLCGACIPECPVNAIVEGELEAIIKGEEKSVHDNYGFFGLTYKE